MPDSIIWPVGIFVSDDSAHSFQRLIPSESKSRILLNDINSKTSLDIYIGNSKYIAMRKKKNRNCFVVTEPPEILQYENTFLDFFDIVAGPKFAYLGNRRNFLVNNPIIPYFVGIDYPITGRLKLMNRSFHWKNASDPLPIVKFEIQDLLNFELKKEKSLSVIVSAKRMTPQQEDRIRFVRYLKRNSKIPIKIFGGLTKPVGDKFQILANSTHHLAIENSTHNDYWTEKLSDSILALNYTFYAGAPNLADYFDDSIFSAISLSNFKGATKSIEEQYYGRSIDIEHLMLERLKLINDYSLARLIDKVCNLIQ